ncbi:hypothetical protein AM587_10006243 [Phytophthora nicotianae]|uniref:Uncharacterized protein n=1 Tax=Phytophthora nicotianae TaxID=4792 RepID=A0A0W8C019_PHYNI|nr:hypothetical protein AM587_10006243 [Phytophthora nicotianae]
MWYHCVKRPTSKSNMAAPAPSSKWTVAAPLDSRKRTIRPPTSDSYGDWTLDQLKLECTARKLNVVKNTRKQDRVDLLKAWDSNKEAVQALVVRQRKRSKGVSEEEERRSAGCMFRLINVLFSDRFFDSFLTSGNLLPRDVLDDGGSTFWFDVANAFASDTTEYDTLISGDAVFEDIDTSSHMAHSAAKLKRMWKEVSSHFARAEAGSKVSGQGSADFWDFCDGRADVYYLALMQQKLATHLLNAWKRRRCWNQTSTSWSPTSSTGYASCADVWAAGAHNTEYDRQPLHEECAPERHYVSQQ